MAANIREISTAFSAPCEIARAMFAEHQSATAAQSGQLTGAAYNSPKNLITPFEYSPNMTFSSTGIAGTYAFPFVSGHTPNTTPAPWEFQGDLTEHYKPIKIRGFVEFQTVAEYCATQSWTGVTRLLWNLGVIREAACSLVNIDTKTAVNEYETFKDWVIPRVFWYSLDGGTIKPFNHRFNPIYWAVATQNYYSAYSYIGVAGGKIAYPTATNVIAQGNPVYFGFGVPHLGNQVANDVRGSLLTGTHYSVRWSTRELVSVTVTGETTPPFITLQGARTFTPTAHTIREVSSVVNLPFPAVNIGIIPVSSGEFFSAYPDKDSAVNLFADFGIFVSDNLDEVLNYEPPAEPDTEINPDNPADPMPSFPDNSTETTPIDSTFITPASFGQALIYSPATLKNVLNWVCDSTVNIDNWKRLFANPADVITGINLFNLDIVNHDTSRILAKNETNILGVTTEIPTHIMLDGYNNIVDGGQITLKSYYGNYADFTSMTYQMYIPFVGFVTLRASDVVNRNLHLYYAVDFSSGAAVAFVNSDNKLIYTAACTVAGKIPLSISDRNSQTINNTLSAIGSVGSLISGVASGNIAGGVGGLFSGLGGLQLQTNYANRGNLSSVNIYKLLPAFIERTRYDLFLPSGEQSYLGAAYQTAAGAPTTEFTTLANAVDTNGYVECEFVKLNSSTATEEEQEQIIALLKSGVYL